MNNTKVKLQNGNYLDGDIRLAAITMVHNNFDTTNYKDKLITLIERKKTDDECVIVVKVS